jgi:hypothetical protein
MIAAVSDGAGLGRSIRTFSTITLFLTFVSPVDASHIAVNWIIAHGFGLLYKLFTECTRMTCTLMFPLCLGLECDTSI